MDLKHLLTIMNYSNIAKKSGPKLYMTSSETDEVMYKVMISGYCC